MGMVPLQLADVLGKFVQRSGYTAGQLAKLTTIPKPTIVNWLDGRVRRPRGVADLLRLAAAMHLGEAETDELLLSAAHPPVAELRQTAHLSHDSELIGLLVRFVGTETAVSTPIPFQALPDIPDFVGRSQIIADIEAQLLTAQGQRLVSIQGMGGVGKTTLATHLAYRLRHHFPDGVLWAQVADSDLMAILSTFASAFGRDVSQYVDMPSRSRIVRDILGSKRVLIVLDGVDSSQSAKLLLPPTGTCAVLMTTRRQDLSLARYAYQVQLPPFDVAQEESLALFAQVLGAQPVAQKRPFFTELANLLGHLPLAIDIAAARIAYEPGWSIENFLQRIRQEKRRIGELAYDDQSVRLSFAASFDGLERPLQQFFAALSLFGSDDFSSAAAAGVTGLEPEQVQDYLRQLYSLSLLSPARQLEEGDARFRLHALLRDFVANRDDVTAYERPFAQFFVQWAVQHQPDFERLATERRHLQAALQLAQNLEAWPLLVQGVIAMYPFWEAQGLYDEAKPWLDLAQTALAQLEQPEAALTIYAYWGRYWQRRGEYIEAEMSYETAVSLAREQKNVQQLSQILRNLGILVARKGDYGLAEAYYKEGLQLARQMGLGGAVSDFLRGLGVQAYIEGDLAKAEAFYEEGWALMSLAPDSERLRVRCGKLWGLGVLAQEHGHTDEAEQHMQQALALAHEIGHQERIIVLERSLGALYAQSMQLELAEQLYAQALEMARQIGHRWQVARVLGELGEVLLTAVRQPEADALFREQYSLARILQSQELAAIAQFGLARAALLASHHRNALVYGRQSLDTFTAIGHQRVRQVQSWIADLAANQSQP